MLVASLCFVSSPLAAELSEQLVAKVGNIGITKSELSREQSKLLPFNVSFHGGISAEKKQQIYDEALSTLMDRAMKVQYALENEISVPPKKVDEKFNGFLEKAKGEEGLIKALGGETVSDFRASLYRELLAEEAEKVAVKDKVVVTDAEVKAYYDQNNSRFMRPRQYQASHILVRVDPSSNAEEREALEKKAEDLLARAKAGEDFYNLAYYNSDDRSKYVGGDLGVFHEGQTVAEFDEALKIMKVGDIVGPVKTMYGLHIIKLVKLDESRQLSFEEMAGKIKETLTKEQYDKLYNQWMSGLKDKYSVVK